jgi:ankyrin repeat protein
VYCQVVCLSGCFAGRIQHALAQLPKTLDETYARMLQEINNANWEIAHRLFQCVAVASRPLRVEELAEFLAFDFEAGLIPQFNEDWRQEDPVDAVLSICSSLLAIVNSEDSTVIQFSHFSVKEYLTSTRLAEASDAVSRRFHVSMASAHTLIAQACLGILLHLDENITSDTLQTFPLIEYAAQHWIGHAQFENVSQNLEDGMKRLFHPGKPHLSVWLWIYDPQTPFRGQDERKERPLRPSGTPLHYAVICGLPTIVKFLVVDHSQDVNALGFDANLTPLHLASDRGNVAVARALLEHGANVTARAMYNLTPLHQASYFGHVEIARLLLKHGADVTAMATYGSTPLHYATSWGRMEVVRVLLEHGADVAAQTIDGWTPLLQVSRDGHAELARILLERGADPKVEDKDGWSPLHYASKKGHVKTALVLLEGGADATPTQTNLKDEGKTPLHSASKRGDVETARILLQHGADVATQDRRGWTPLHSAARRGRIEVVSALLGCSADVTTRDERGRNPLHLASRGGTCRSRPNSS